jgi:hypothetical protein
VGYFLCTDASPRCPRSSRHCPQYIFGGEVTGCVAKLLLFELVAKTRLLDHLTRRLVVGMVLGLAISPTDFSNMTVSKDLHKYNS